MKMPGPASGKSHGERACYYVHAAHFRSFSGIKGDNKAAASGEGPFIIIQRVSAGGDTNDHPPLFYHMTVNLFQR